MSQPNKQPRRKLRSGVHASNVGKLLDALRALDSTMVEISMHIYKFPSRDRAAMREHHRRLHDTLRERFPRFLYQSQRST